MPTSDQASLRLPQALQLQTATCAAATAALAALPAAAPAARLRDCHAEARHTIPSWLLLPAARPVLLVIEGIRCSSVLLLSATCVVQ